MSRKLYKMISQSTQRDHGLLSVIIKEKTHTDLRINDNLLHLTFITEKLVVSAVF